MINKGYKAVSEISENIKNVNRNQKRIKDFREILKIQYL